MVKEVNCVSFDEGFMQQNLFQVQKYVINFLCVGNVGRNLCIYVWISGKVIF